MNTSQNLKNVDFSVITNEDFDPESISERKFISVISNKVCAQVAIAKIEFIEQEGRKIHIHTDSNDYLCYQSMEKVAVALGGRAFYRPMKSLILNFERVARLENQEIVFASGYVFPLGRNNFIKVRQAFKRYLMHYPPFSTLTGARVAEDRLYK